MADEALILKLAADDLNQTEIAQRVGCSQSSVSRLLTEFTDSRRYARAILDRDAASVAARLAQTKHAPTMLELMRDLGVTEKKAPVGESKGGVTVLIGVKDSDVQIQVGSSDLSPQLSPDIHSVTVEPTGSSV